MALADEVILPLAATDQRFLNGFPFQAATEAFQRAPGAGAVGTGPDHQRIRQGVGPVEQLVIAAIEKILHGAAHVAEIFRCQEYHGAGRQDIVGDRLQRCEDSDCNRIAAFSGTFRQRPGHGLQVGRGRMSDDQQRW